MSNYEFSFRQEILMEKGAAVLGDLFRFERKQGSPEKTQSTSLLYDLVWTAKQDILVAKSECDLAMIEGRFDLVHDFLSKLEVSGNA